MTEELPPADINLIPIGIILPFERGKVHKDFYEFNGQTILQRQDPLLFEALSLLEGEAQELFEEWGGKIGYRWAKLPKLDKDEVTHMVWGIKTTGFDAVLAIRAQHSGN